MQKVSTVALLAASFLNANPLVELATPLQWDKIQPSHIVPAIKHHLKVAEERRAALASVDGPHTWENTMEARDRITEDLERAWTVVSHLHSVNNSPELRKEYNAAQPLVIGFSTSLSLDPAIYSRVKAFSETAEAKALQGAHRRALTVALDQYRRSGVTLPDAERAKVLELRQELSKLSTQFAQNALDSLNSFELIVTDEAELAGLPASALEAAAASAKSKGKTGYRFTLQAPSMLPVMQYADNAALREKLYRAQTTLASSGVVDNRPVIARALTLRRELAKVLGYRDFADYQTELRMAKNGRNVKEFLGKLETETRPYFEKEAAALLAFRRELEGENAPPLRGWDVAYYTRKLGEKQFQFSQEELRPYLELDRTIAGMFQLVNQLYGIRVRELKDIPVWHPAVRVYRIDDESGIQLATFYADFFPRESKRAGAWMNQFVVGAAETGKRSPHIGLIVTNATPPNGQGKTLLTHREVETLYHEFGHLLHLALSEGPVRDLNGTSVAWDFVELPSQIMENFTWEKSVLNTFAIHNETGAPLPDKLYDKMIQSRAFNAASTQMRQLGLGTMDILLHTEFQPNADYGPPEDYTRKLAQRFSAAPIEPDACTICSFSHIFAGGYAAGYYSYKWAEVLDADAFTKFQANGVVSRKTGEEFRRSILSRGNSEPAADLYRNFMGRDPNTDALQRRNGMAPRKEQ